MAVLAATQPSELDVKVRNKLYAAMKRVFNATDADKLQVSGAVCATLRIGSDLHAGYDLGSIGS